MSFKALLYEFSGFQEDPSIQSFLQNMILVAGIPEITSREFSFGEMPTCSINCLISDLLNLSTEEIHQ